MAHNTPAAQDRALRYLDLVRKEFQQRVELKQQVLAAYILGLAAFLAFVIQGYTTNPQLFELLCLMPGLSFCAAALFADHMLVTTSLSRYIKLELEPHLIDAHCKIAFWDRSKAATIWLECSRISR
jgi:hypothetical protein